MKTVKFDRNDMNAMTDFVWQFRNSNCNDTLRDMVVIVENLIDKLYEGHKIRIELKD